MLRKNEKRGLKNCRGTLPVAQKKRLGGRGWSRPAVDKLGSTWKKKWNQKRFGGQERLRPKVGEGKGELFWGCPFVKGGTGCRSEAWGKDGKAWGGTEQK